MSFQFTITGTVVGIQVDFKNQSTVLKIQADQRARFDAADVMPAPVLIRIPRHIDIDGLGHRDTVTVVGNCGVGTRQWHEKNNFGKETGRSRDIYLYTFEAETVTRAETLSPRNV